MEPAVLLLCRVCYTKYSDNSFDSVLLYLQHHQQHITSLELTGLDPEQLWIEVVLPTCSAVERLVLHQWSVQLGPSGDALEALLSQGQGLIDLNASTAAAAGAAAAAAAGASSSSLGAVQLAGSGSDAIAAGSSSGGSNGDSIGGSSWQDPLGILTSDNANPAGLNFGDSSSLREVLGSTRSNQGLLQGLPALKELHMLNCCFCDDAGDLATAAAAGVLPGLTNLEHLVATWKDGDTPDALLTGACCLCVNTGSTWAHACSRDPPC
jgi:hypothetical protein